MRPLRYSINVTLDGCCHHEAGLPPDEESMGYWTAEMEQADALLFGRVTYEMMESAWRQPATGTRPDWMDEWEIPFAKTTGRYGRFAGPPLPTSSIRHVGVSPYRRWGSVGFFGDRKPIAGVVGLEAPQMTEALVPRAGGQVGGQALSASSQRHPSSATRGLETADARGSALSTVVRPAEDGWTFSQAWASRPERSRLGRRAGSTSPSSAGAPWPLPGRAGVRRAM